MKIVVLHPGGRLFGSLVSMRTSSRESDASTRPAAEAEEGNVTVETIYSRLRSRRRARRRQRRASVEPSVGIDSGSAADG